MRRGKIAEDELRAFLWGRVEPHLVNLPNRLIDLGIWMLADVREHEPKIERGFAAVGRDFEHIVVARIDLPAFDLLDTRDELLDIPFKLGGRWSADCHGPALVHLRHG